MPLRNVTTECGTGPSFTGRGQGASTPGTSSASACSRHRRAGQDQGEFRIEKHFCRCIANPFGDVGAERLYRSGDLVIPLPGGDMQYVGRADAQVKVRGFRVELGEIESLLVRHEAVKDAAVALRDEHTEFAKLVAYIIPSGDAVPALKDVRGFLSRSVPEYMLPNAVVAVDEMPTTPSGKLDRKKLPWPAER